MELPPKLYAAYIFLDHQIFFVVKYEIYFLSSHNIFAQGSYNNYECGLAISDAEAADDGDWSCEFESYVRNGKRGDGTLASVSGALP